MKIQKLRPLNQNIRNILCFCYYTRCHTQQEKKKYSSQFCYNKSSMLFFADYKTIRRNPGVNKGIIF